MKTGAFWIYTTLCGTEAKQNSFFILRKSVLNQMPQNLINRADRWNASLKAKTSWQMWWMEVKAVPTVLLREHTLSPNRRLILWDVDTMSSGLSPATSKDLHLITGLNWPPDSADTLVSTRIHTPNAYKLSFRKHTCATCQESSI